MESEDEFESQIKQRCLLVNDKENIDQTYTHLHLKAKLDEISFFSSDFQDSDS